MEAQRFCFGEDCKTLKPASEFHVYCTRVCKKCHSARVQKSKKKAIEKRQLEAKSRECSCCEVLKNFSEYPQKSLTNICNECYQKKKVKRTKPLKKKPTAKERREQLERENKELREQLDQLSLLRDGSRRPPRGDQEQDPFAQGGL